jgi:glucose/arabinose dehydrogenase
MIITGRGFGFLSALAAALVISACSGGSSAGSISPPPPADTTAPVITLLGNAAVTLTVGDAYTDAGATATDDVDGDISADIVTVNPVDNTAVGSYAVTYNVSDAAGNPATEVMRTVDVVAVVPPPSVPTIALNPVFPGVSFVDLVKLVQAPGDSSRWFAVEKRGIVRVFDNDPNVMSATAFIDISARVNAGPNEAGLLGMAFHPDWGVAGNFEVFLSYTHTGAALESYISRFHSLDNGATLDSTTEEVIMTVLQPFSNHNGGNVEFGPDGFLYSGWGDGGSGGDPQDNAQNTSTLLGTMTRVDVDGGTPYAIPTDNPFATNGACTQGVGAAACPEIFAWGLRNPWRWSFDSINGELWVGDVGQGAIEEVDRVELNGNYGWRCREGSATFDTSGNCPAGLIDPITEYGRGAGQSITGGYVYRGAAIPELQGFYVFADFLSGRIWALPASSGTGSSADELLDTNFFISSFAEGNDGELYVLDYTSGSIHKVIDAP